MASIVPSYLAKVSRAKEHLVDLQIAVNEFALSHPYAVRKRVEGKKQKVRWRLEFTSNPTNTPIPILAADAIYNLRSSLDHLMSALVAPKDRGSAMFPVYFQGVWEAIVPGENQQRVKERMRWASDIKTLPDDAVAVLKTLQPPNTAADDPTTNLLRLINRLSNRDRHERLPVIAAGLSELQARVRLTSGIVLEAVGVQAVGEAALQNGAELHDIPDDAVNVEIEGVPVVAIPGKLKNRYIEIPRRLVYAADYIETRIIPKLAPHVRSDAA